MVKGKPTIECISGRAGESVEETIEVKKAAGINPDNSGDLDDGGE